MSLTFRVPKELSFEKAKPLTSEGVKKKKKKTSTSSSSESSLLKRSKNEPNKLVNKNCQADYTNHECTETPSIEQNTIFIDPETTYAVELEKIQGIIPTKDYKSFLLPDFNIDKRQLLCNKIRCVKRRKVYLDDHEESIYWLYSCSCDEIRSNFIESLSDVISAPLGEDDNCIHVSIVKLAVPDDSELEGLDEESNVNGKQGVFIKEVPFCDNMLIISVDGDIGVVQGLDKGSVFCVLCSSPHCKHSSTLKDYQKENGLDNFPSSQSSEEDEKLLSYQPITIELNDIQKSVLNKRPQDIFRMVNIEGSEIFSVGTENGEECSFCGTQFDYGPNKPYEIKHLIYRNEMYSCAVFNLTCSGCEAVHLYDGKEDALFHYGRFLIHHSVLRDYMFHFLNGNSCTLHGFYEIWKQHHQDNFNVNFPRVFGYHIWRKSWYGFLSLIEIKDRDFQCSLCGIEPSIIVCDATSLGFQRRYLTFRKENDDLETIPRMSQFNDRIAIPVKEARDQLIKWCNQPTKPPELLKLKRSLQSFSELFDVFLWALECFPVRLPKEIKTFFVVLARPSPICSLIKPCDEMFRLLDRLFQENIKRDVVYMEQLHMSLPIFHGVLTSIFEPKLPFVWKPLIKYLIVKSLVPFNQSKVLPDIPSSDEDSLDFFPHLPLKRGRGKYELDNGSAVENVCNKFYRGHPKLTPGIFTLFCPHGINYGFQVMRCVESTNIPFTIFKTRFQKAPDIIIYDNACNLHNYCLNRDPAFFKDTQFLVDRFHWPNHKGCSLSYHIGIYPRLKSINSQINEQQNAAIKKLKSQISFMTPQNFLMHCKFFMSYRNLLKQKQVK